MGLATTMEEEDDQPCKAPALKKPKLADTVALAFKQAAPCRVVPAQSASCLRIVIFPYAEVFVLDPLF